MTRKSILTFIAACLVLTATFAQNLQNHIPKDVAFVMTMNPAVLNSKVKFAKLKEFDFFKMGMQEMTKQAGPMADEIKKFVDDPASFGMDLMSSSYAFATVEGKNIQMAYVMKVADKAKFDALIEKYIAPMAPVTKAANMDFISQDGMNLAWNKDHIMISSVEVEYQEGEEWDARNARKAKMSETWMNSVAKSNKLNSISSHPQFKLANVGADDVNFFMNYETFMEMTEGMDAGYQDPMTKMMMDMMSGMYKDTYASIGLNFDKGATKMVSKYFMNDEMKEIYNQVIDAPFNKKFLQYIPKNNMGVVSYNINLGKVVELIKNSDNEMLAQYPIYEGMAVEALKGMGVEMPAEDIYKLWNGDVVLVVTGIKEFEKEVTTFEFDDDFNKKEIKEMRKEMLPEFMMMMSHKNKDGLLKLIDLGKQSSMINEVNGYFQMSVPDMPMDVYMKVENDMVLVSNKMDAVTKKAKSVFNKKDLMSIKDAKEMMNSSMYMIWNVPETMNEIAKMEDVKLDGPEGMMLNMGKDSFDNVKVTADKKIGTSMNSVMSLNFNNKDINSLEQIFGMINKAVMSMTDGSSM